MARVGLRGAIAGVLVLALLAGAANLAGRADYRVLCSWHPFSIIELTTPQ